MLNIDPSHTEEKLFTTQEGVCTSADDSRKSHIATSDLTRRAAQEILEFNKIRDIKQNDRLTSE